MKTLILTVGLPCSGKSTWAKSSGPPVVSPDTIRLAMHGQRFSAQAEPFVWAVAHVMVSALFLAGHETVILDACSNSARRRREWDSREYETIVRVFDADKETCIERAKAVGREFLIPVIERMDAECDWRETPVEAAS